MTTLPKLMGRTIPSFRQLLEIEKLDWSGYKKSLPTKKDKKPLMGYLRMPIYMPLIYPMR